jgi:putative polyhydroxyalkanoate system protein
VAKKVTTELGGRYGIVSAWNGNSARISGSGITGELIVEPKRFDINLKLGLFMMMFRDKIEAGIEGKLDTLLTAKSKQSGKPAPKKG